MDRTQACGACNRGSTPREGVNVPTITLETKLEDIFRLTDAQKRGLRKLSLATVEDLMRYVPTRYIKRSEILAIENIVAGNSTTVEGKISGLDFEKTWKKRLNIAKAKLTDDTGNIDLVWFHQPYIARILKNDDIVRVTGKVGQRRDRLFISNPLYEKIDRLSYRGPAASGELVPTYSQTRGVSSRWLHFHIHKLFKDLPREAFRDLIPDEILKRYHLPALLRALYAAHFPKSEKEAEAARKRLAFEEIFYIQLSRMQERMALDEKSSLVILTDKNEHKKFLDQLPFKLTSTQTTILDTVLDDIGKKTPMARLLEGDVGSGKTIIAAAASYQTARAGYQTAYMAPTEILARQHFDVFTKYAGGLSWKIGFLASSEALVWPSKAFRGQPAHIPKSQLARWTESGEIKILIGTHALLGSKVRFKNLAFIIVDEQHRFGVRQRGALAKRKSSAHNLAPHFLSMTATPIPRTLALTVFGDLDLSVLDELPPGRKSIRTEIFIKPKERSWDAIRREIEQGRQAFVICPRIRQDEEKSEMKSVAEEFKKISTEIFPEYRSAMLHGKLTPREKEKIMAGFKKGSVQILVSTSLIEVGIDIPNATIMVVEGADRFGLAQLHQLRGRIGRGEHSSYFVAATDSGSKKTAERLRALRDAKNGFELAEYDLSLRGPGELTGKNQWGISDIGMEALKNIKMVEAARAEARALLARDRELHNYPTLKTKLTSFDEHSLHHFE